MGMRRPRNNMGRVKWIGAEALGLPGQRTFRLLTYSDAMSAQLWLEKELLQALIERVARLIAQIDSEKTDQSLSIRKSAAPNVVPKPADFPAEPDIEIHVVSLGLRYDPERELIALEASDHEIEDNEPPTFRCLTTPEQMEALQANGLEVLSAGRPRCPLCGTPLNEPGMPHFCPPTNGHQRLVEEES